MVYCGKLSKACQRCRKRKLKCDLTSPSCGQCIRANESCAGYRDTSQLQIRNESQTVRRKALSKQRKEPSQLPTPPDTSPQEIVALPLALDVQAHDAFFNFYVGGRSAAWEFISSFDNGATTPVHLQACINAVSFAFLAHQMSSSSAFSIAREKYAVALRMTGTALQSKDTVATDTTLLSSLLLDLFEKFMHSEPSAIDAYTGHIVGALALVRARGLQKFDDSVAAKMLLRLSNNLLISCIASGTRPPAGLKMLKEYAGRILNVPITPKWKLSSLMVHYATLRNEMLTDSITTQESIFRCIDLEAKLQEIALDIPPAWDWKTVVVSDGSPHILHRRADIYADRFVTQAWNVISLTRILLNEALLDSYASFGDAPEGNPYQSLVAVARNNVVQLAQQICFSASQFVDCDNIRHGTFSEPKSYQHIHGTSYGSSHSHHPEWNLDCYSLLFPLFVAGRSKWCAGKIRDWVGEQLRYMGDHYNIRNAASVAKLLDKGDKFSPWDIYGMLGSYAFAA